MIRLFQKATLPLALVSLSLPQLFCGGPPPAYKGGVRVALAHSAACEGKACYSEQERRRFQQASSLYTRMYGKKTIDNKELALEGQVVLRGRVNQTGETPRLTDVAVDTQTVGNEEFRERLLGVFEGIPVASGTSSAQLRTYVLQFSHSVYSAQPAFPCDSTTMVIVPALR